MYNGPEKEPQLSPGEILFKDGTKIQVQVVAANGASGNPEAMVLRPLEKGARITLPVPLPTGKVTLRLIYHLSEKN